MSAVEGRYGQDVHEGEDDAEEGRHQPESVPVPCVGEEAAYGSESAQRLGTVCGEEVLQVVDIG